MKKYLPLFIITIITTCYPLNAMESRTGSTESTESEDEWNVVNLSNQSFDCKDNLDMVDQEINRQFEKLFTRISESNAHNLIGIIQQIFPDIVIDYFFIKKLREQNTLFNKALTIITQQCTQRIRTHLTGSTIDNLNVLLQSSIGNFSTVMQQYITTKACEPFEKKENKQFKAETKIRQITKQHELTGQIGAIAEDGVYVYNTRTNAILHVLPTNTPIRWICFNTDGSLIAVLSAFGIHILHTAALTCKFLKTKTPCNHVRFINNTNYFAATACDKRIFIWEYNNDKFSFVKQIASDQYVSYVANNNILFFDASHAKNDQTKAIVSLPNPLPTLCTLAFNNSKNDKKELKLLEQSDTLKQLQNRDKSSLQTSITQQLAALSEQKKKAQPKLMQVHNDFELKQIKQKTPKLSL